LRKGSDFKKKPNGKMKNKKMVFHLAPRAATIPEFYYKSGETRALTNYR